ncbi:MAG TPA: transglycosylase family protein [Solirubrobacterales bacterium]|nr:transglycosylase family protein [Solirubrobacterales bacterium]
MARSLATKAGVRGRLAVIACAVLVSALIPAAIGAAASVGALQDKVSAARSEAGAMAAELQATQSELAAAEQEAAAAASREQRLSSLLATGEDRAARLAAEVRLTKRRLMAEKRRLRRARGALADRLVAIYESGSPSAASVILASSDFDDLATRSEYLERIEQSDTELASRVAQVRRAVAAGLARVAALKARVDAYNERLSAARSEISAVRQSAEAAATQLNSVVAARAASLATLKSKIGEWVSDIEAAEAASRAEAESTVERWLGGPYSIPTYIVMCESGGNYGAINPSSGAGGAYQILPSTWDLYGGEGAPHEAPKAEQDRIAAEIWADSGGSAWVCA